MKHPWVIVGSGNLGGIVAARLLQAGESVIRLSRHITEVTAQRLKVSGYTEYDNVIQTVPNSDSIPENAVWVIPVKAWQLQGVLLQYREKISEAHAIIVCHNGMGAASAEIESLQAFPIYDWVTTHGAWQEESGDVHHSGLGESWIGPRFPSTRQLPCVDRFAEVLPPLHWDEQILVRRWTKLAVNCAINPIATLLDVPNGALRDTQYQEEIAGICHEISNIYKAETNSVLDAQQLIAMVYQVIEKTEHNLNSMLQDLRNERETEIEYLNGFIEKRGQQLLLPTPFNSKYAAQIRSRTASHRS